jgi:hypothetical protein
MHVKKDVLMSDHSDDSKLMWTSSTVVTSDKKNFEKNDDFLVLVSNMTIPSDIDMSEVLTEAGDKETFSSTSSFSSEYEQIATGSYSYNPNLMSK